MPVKRRMDTPQGSRKRPRVPKFDEQQSKEDEEGPARRPEEADDDEDDIQADYEEEGGYFVEDIYIPPKLSLSEQPTHGERLIIEKIECENFKSYGGHKVMGPFHKSFSAIIGPNGNGKSNIIDAMLFVFGYRAKKIRCKKVSVLIHKSELLPDLPYCGVTVHFLKIIDNGEEDSDHQLNIVPNSRITVCRRAYRNNTSAYWLNKQKVQFTEVARFLKQSGIDIVHNRFLILQGEVEQIAQMPPKANATHETGFLEFIDEVIGTKRYEKSLFQLKERMETLDFQREEKAQRVTLAEQHKGSLIEPMKKATAFLRDRNTKIRTNHTLNQVKAFHCRRHATEKAEKLKDLEETRNTITARLDEIKKFHDEKKHEYVAAEKEYQLAEARLAKNKKVMDDADAKYVQLNREIKASNEDRKKKIKEKEKTEEELEKLHGLPERHEAEIKKLEKRKIDLDSDIEKEEIATKGDLERLMKQVDQCVAEKKKADVEFRKLKAAMDEKKAARDTLQKELDRGKANEQAEKEKLEKLEQELQKLQENVRRKSGQGLDVTPDQIRAKEAEAQKKRQKAEELMNQEQEKRAKFHRLRGQYAEAKESADGGKITGAVDKAVFDAKAQGMFQGVYGRLKDLATIEEKYNIAATAASGYADYWIVDTDQTAADVIKFLKDNRLPFQSFLCVSKMGDLASRCRAPFKTPKDAQRIFDLLKIRHPETAPCFFKAFTNTLVAEDLDTATRVAYGGSTRYRVVTTSGEIVESSGSLLGGGNKLTQGKYNSEMAKRLGNPSMSKKQIEDLKAKCDDAEKEVSAILERRRACEEEANELEKEAQEIKMKIANYQSDLEASRKMIPLKTAQIKEQEQKVKAASIPDRILKEKMKKIEEAEKELESAKEPYEEAEEKVRELTEKVKSLQEGKKKEILKKLDKFKEQRKRVVEELNKLNVELRNFEKNKSKLETKLKKLTEDIETIQKKMLEMNDERKKLEATASNLKEEAAVLTKDKEEKEKIYSELKSKSSEFDQEEKKLKKQKVTLDNNFQTLSDEVNRYQREERALLASLEKFELKEIPEVELEPLAMLTEEQLQEASIKELEGRLQKYTKKLEREEPNLNIIEDYNAACQTLLKRIADLDEVNKRRDNINTAYLTLEAQRMKEFMEGYAKISAKVKELFRMISMGGDAELDLMDSTDPFSCGIDFAVRPRGKTWKKIVNLSGGEKTLSSLALVFSLHHFKPSPFYVMDEIDAALDFQNVSIIANYIKDRTKFTQFIIISLRSNMFELADSLLGVYKVDNMSYSIRIGVNNVVNKLRSKHQANNKPYLMGQDDPGSISSRRGTTTTTTRGTTQATVMSSQATVASQSQPANSTAVVPGQAKKPSFEVSAINESQVSVQNTTVVPASSQGNKKATSDNVNQEGSKKKALQQPVDSDASSGVGQSDGASTERVADSDGASTDRVVEGRTSNGNVTDDDEVIGASDEEFENSVQTDNTRGGPLATSTPFLSSPIRRKSMRVILPQVTEQDVESESDESDNEDVIASSFSSQHNSQ